MLNQFWGNKLSNVSRTQKVVWGILWLNMLTLPVFAQNSHLNPSFSGEASFDYSIPRPSSIMSNRLAQAIPRSGTFKPPTYPTGSTYPSKPNAGISLPKPNYATGGGYQVPKPSYGIPQSKPIYPTGGGYQAPKPSYGIPQSKPIYPTGGVYKPKSIY